MLSVFLQDFLWSFLAFLSILAALGGSGVYAYIPASPVNTTDPSLNSTTASHLNLRWFGGGYQEDISYQLVGANSNGVNKGALVHFSEEKLPNDTTTTPWIALVSCDANATDASQEDDIFTLARDRGAVAALLYSLYSERCEINPEYADPANFDQLMDIFATPSLQSSQFIEYEYGAINATKFGHYDAALLNSSGAEINSSIANGTVTYKGFMFATLTAFNATANGTTDAPDPTTTSSTDSGGGSGPNTSLAMIILYAITGCVSALFCVVIVSGAIRAIRHPERYGPRNGDAYGPAGYAQSRARGITRAILETFPVVKFGRPEQTEQPVKDIESLPDSRGPGKTDGSGTTVEMSHLENVDHTVGGVMNPAVVVHGEKDETMIHEDVGEEEEDVTQAASSSQLAPIPRPRRVQIDTTPRQSGIGEEKDVVPDAIGRETCPICIVDFEEGDDLRVLPCEGHHRFHQACVDPWLLELSSSCPICRQDFHALETMMNRSDEGDHLEPPAPLGSSRPLSNAGARFSRYIRMARRRRGRNQNREGPHGYDPTNPTMPIAAETSL
ncbi:hypothetical protein ABKN59_002875 [Abortiporus biennis]